MYNIMLSHAASVTSSHNAGLIRRSGEIYRLKIRALYQKTGALCKVRIYAAAVFAVLLLSLSFVAYAAFCGDLLRLWDVKCVAVCRVDECVLCTIHISMSLICSSLMIISVNSWKHKNPWKSNTLFHPLDSRTNTNSPNIIPMLRN